MSTHTLQDSPWLIKGTENHFERAEIARRKQLEKQALYSKNIGGFFL